LSCTFCGDASDDADGVIWEDGGAAGKPSLRTLSSAHFSVPCAAFHGIANFVFTLDSQKLKILIRKRVFPSGRQKKWIEKSIFFPDSQTGGEGTCSP
jgi:hypothetical protein